MYVLTPGARVRFISYLDIDVALGVNTPADKWTAPPTAVKRLSEGNRTDRTIFVIEVADNGAFRLRWAADQGQYLAWQAPYKQLWLIDKATALHPRYCETSLFTVDAVKDGNWFALNNAQHTHVVDIDHGSTASGTAVFSWRWNGGDNQVWRSEAA